jgi:uncharacterized membrane protein YfcA
VTPQDAVLVGVAGFLAGAVNSVAGGGSLISFPALLAVLGSSQALAANVTNTVGLVTGYFGGTVAYRRELAGQRRRVRDLAATALVGAAAGCALLLLTPDSVFRAVVPWLVLGGSLLLLAQPRVAAWLRRRGGGELHPHPVALHVAVFLGGTYGAYFGAALGVMLLAALGVLLPDDLQRLNALKGLLSLVVAVLAAAVYAVLAPVHWAAALVLAVTSLVGGHTGGVFARRLSPRVLRVAVVVFGVAVGIRLMF